MGFPNGSESKETACSAGDTGDVGSISRLGRLPGGGNGHPLQCSCLKNPMDSMKRQKDSTIHMEKTDVFLKID